MEGSWTAVVGLGRMGAAMASTLSRAGLELVVYNRTRAVAETVAEHTGARVADSPREAADGAGVVVTSLADDAAVREVFGGSDGLAAGLRPGTVVLEMSTIDPSVVHEVAGLVEASGARLVDAPVSGSVHLVEQGALTVMAGGDAAALEQAGTVLDALAARVFHMGGQGSGATMKLAVNALVAGINGALAEALVMAENAGIDRRAAYDVFGAGAGGAPFVHYKQAAYLEPDTAPVAFSIDLVAKDLGLITRLGRQVGVDMPIAKACLSLAEDAIAAGLGERDMSALAVHLRNSAT